MITSEWNDYRISDFLDIKNGKSRPIAAGEIPIYGGNGVLGYSDEANVNGETIIIGRVGAYCGSTFYTDSPIWVSDNALYAKVKAGFDAKFVYYLLKQDNLNQYAGGSSHPLLTQSRLNDLQYSLPDLPTQRRIAAILSSLDDKIELNNAKNKNLEELAQALFKRWFVDFEFPMTDEYAATIGKPELAGQPYKSSGGEMVESEMGMIPKGWEVKALEEIGKINIGRTPPRLEQHWFGCGNQGVKWVSIRDMGQSGAYISETAETLSAEAILKFNIPIVPKDTCILSFKLTVGRLAITTEEMLTNEAIAHIIPELLGFSSRFVYLTLKNFDFNTLGSTSSIATAVNTKSIKSIKILAPTYEVLNNFDKIVKAIFEKLELNIIEIQNLRNTRDSLLPRIISGQIRI